VQMEKLVHDYYDSAQAKWPNYTPSYKINWPYLK
jgi:hypothetical protein